MSVAPTRFPHSLVRFVLVLCLFLCLCAGGQWVWAAPYHAIICGSGGEPEFEEKFRTWGIRLRQTLIERMGLADERVRLLTEGMAEPGTDGMADGEQEHGTTSLGSTGMVDGEQEHGTTSLESIRALFQSMAETVGADDDLYVYLIGHGSYLNRRSKFHIPGPDLTAEELDGLLDGIDCRRQVILNATASSAGFINTLSGPNRVICTATKSVDENNATEYMEYFVEGLSEGSADRNHDERITFLEACEYAAEMTATWYLGEGLIATEHAILDDNGDGLGSRLPMMGLSDEWFAGPNDGEPAVFDGALAELCFLLDFSIPPNAPKAIVDTYLGTLDAVAALKKNKKKMESKAYYANLEELLVKAARANREIHTYSDAASSPAEADTAKQSLAVPPGRFRGNDEARIIAVGP